MDFNLKQWRSIKLEQEEHELPKLDFLNSHNYQHHPSDSSSSALPLLVAEPTSWNLSAAYSSSEHPNTPPVTNKFPRMGSYFSLPQWQELELQALIYRHMIAGAAVPSELLHLVKKSIITSNPPPYYLSHPLNQYYPHYQPTLVQSGYWGRGAMDPEPGRCRRTDGKKWRCSRDVVTGQKYCERHVHRGRNRSRKPVEIPTSTTTASAAATPYSGGSGESSRKTFITNTHTQGMVAGSSGGVPHFTLSGPSPSMDLLQLNRRPCDSIIETKGPFEVMNSDGQHCGGARTLHFFDDWPKSLHETDRSTNLSISMPENPSSDFSLKLGTGIGDESSAQGVSGEGERPWGGTWGSNNMVAPMGGPLAEALRSSVSNSSSPTSVLHRLRGSTSEASYISA